MKYKFIAIIYLFTLNSTVFSQEIRDQFSNEKISFVEIFSDKGDLIGATNVVGVFSIDLKNKIKSSKTEKLTFVNSFFETKVIESNDFKDGTIFKMNPIINELKEVVISQNKDKNQYLVLKTYVRSLQINNGKTHYFMDGIVEYYISLKTNKVKIKFLSNRSFENKSIKQLKQKGLTKIFFQITGAPMLNEFLNYNNLTENYNFQKRGIETKITSKDDNSVKGYLFTNKNGTNLSLGFITNDKPKVMKGLGVENILENYNINSFFSASNSKEIGFNALMYFKETRNYKIKAKKDIEYQKVDVTHEVFVLDYRFSEEIDAKKLDQNYSFTNSSSYSEEYWKKVNNVLFQPLAEPIELFIKENLIELK